jgi:flagellar M-ring protein FliF
LAAQGLPNGGESGYELFDKPSLGFSEFMQKANYLRALQGELSRTIVQMNHVRSARVMVVTPKERLYLKGAERVSTASVFVDTGGADLPLHSVNAIRFLVANAVEGLSTHNVSVVDNRGHVLTEALNEDPTMPGMNGRWRARRDLENYFRQQIETLLLPIAGPSGVIARVAVDLNEEGYTKREKRFDPEGAVVRSQTTTEDSSNSNQQRQTSAVGVQNEIDVGANEVADTPVSMTQDTRKVRTTEYEINESTTETRIAPGSINNISASVVLSQRLDEETGEPILRSEAEINRVREIVANAIGVRSADDWATKVTVAEMPFDNAVVNPVIPSASFVESILQHQRVLIQGAALLLAAGLFYWFTKVLKRTRMEFSSLQQVEDVSPSARNVTPQITAEMLNELVEKRSENVSATLQNWIREGEASNNA